MEFERSAAAQWCEVFQTIIMETFSFSSAAIHYFPIITFSALAFTDSLSLTAPKCVCLCVCTDTIVHVRVCTYAFMCVCIKSLDVEFYKESLKRLCI